MPIRQEDGITPRGRPCLRLYSTGVVTLADSEALLAVVGPGGKYHRQRVITIASKDVEYTAEARKHLPTTNGNYLALAVVLQSTIVRAAINLMMRFAKDLGAVHMFSTEEEAMAWLDSVE